MPSIPWSDTAACRAWLLGEVAAGRLRAADLPAARAALGLVPSPAGWVRLLAMSVLATGASLLACALIFAVAFNWDRLGRFARFALVESALVIAIVLALWRGVRKVAGEAALVAACLITGALLALFGQTYQTGADPVSLFVAWAALILPLALHARRASVWLVWLAVVNVAVALAEDAWPIRDGALRVFGRWEAWGLLATVCNGAVLIAMERFAWLGGAGWRRAVPRVAALMTLSGAVTVLLPALGWRPLWLNREAAYMIPWATAAFAGVAWWSYAWRRDMVVLSAASLGAITLGFGMFMRLFGGANSFGLFLFAALYWIGAVAAVVSWLRDVHAKVAP
jgi:uncharacterized membrane protein